MKRLSIKQSSGLNMGRVSTGRSEFAGMRSLGNLLNPMDDKIRRENR